MRPTELFKELLMRGMAVFSTEEEIKNSVTCTVRIGVPKSGVVKVEFLDAFGQAILETREYEWGGDEAIILTGFKVLQRLCEK